MRLVDYLDKGASLDGAAPCLTTDGSSLSYREVVELSGSIAAALTARGVAPGDRIAIISGNDPLAFSCVFGISRSGAVWCPINPRNEAAENAELLAMFECSVVIFASGYADLVDQIRGGLEQVHSWVCLDAEVPGSLSWREFLDGAGHSEVDRPGAEDVALIVGTGGTTGRPKGVVLTGRNIETMTALTLMSYPIGDRPVYLAMAPLTHAAGVLCFPILACGGEIVIMRTPDIGTFVELIERHRITHSFLPPTLLYMVLGHDALGHTDLSSLRCLWYGAAPISPSRLAEALQRIGPVLGQLFGQTEAPMMISTMAPAQHFNPDGSIATGRLPSAGRPSPLCTVAIMDERGGLLGPGERGEIVLRGSLVMRGYYRDPEASAQASAFGWHHTGDIGYLDDEGYLFVVDRAKDMIITGGFNVYSTEVEQALLAHPQIRDGAVIGLPDDHWGERVVAVVQPVPGAELDPGEVIARVKERIGSVKAPKQVEIWPDLPRSKIGKVLKAEIKKSLLDG